MVSPKNMKHKVEVHARSLPVPEIKDDVVLQHSYKQAHRREESNRLRPPKLKPRNHDATLNRSHLSSTLPATARAISFRGETDGGFDLSALSLSANYDRVNSLTYFEQCFTHLEKIGEGSFGEVFKVRSREDGLLYAVKMSKKLFRGESYRHERLEEVRRYEQFSGHANCVRFYRAWEQDDRLYMQMELCRENLESFLARQRHIPEEQIWSILLDLLLALKSLHDRNLIHLDIKLDNVLIGDDDSCKLADFGLVTDVEKANRNQATEGDSRYIAPEIMEGHFSKAADVFSLGIAMLELACCLELPTNGILWQQLRSGILPQDFIKTISTELQAMIREMMVPNPRARPTVDELLAHKKFESILQSRQRWRLLREMKQNIRRSRRNAWSKLCSLKSIVLKFFSLFLATLRPPASITDLDKPQQNYSKPIPTVRTHLICSTPTSGDFNDVHAGNDFPNDENPLDLSGRYDTSANFSSHVVNSTPVVFRSRKDLTKISFRTIENVADEKEAGAPESRPMSFLDLEEIEANSHSLTQRSFESSSWSRKRLFSKSDDSD